MRFQIGRAFVKRISALALTLVATGGAVSTASAQMPSAPTGIRLLGSLPQIIFESGIENWVVDRFAGNTKAGTMFYQGPAREVGGLISAFRAVETPEGIYIAFGEASGTADVDNPNVVRVSDGMLRLVMEREGLLEGPISLCQGGFPIWNAYDSTLYLTGPYCIRKVVVGAGGARTVERVAGTCGKAGSTDGPALSATLQAPRGWAAAQDGAIYWLELDALRKFAGGVVSTVPLTRPENPAVRWKLSPGYHLLSPGEDANTLYISDYYDIGFTGANGIGILKVDLTTNEVRRFAGMPRDYPDYAEMGETDGPAKTHALFRGGGRALYHPSYGALFLDGADCLRFRWLRLDGDGWVRTIFGTLRPGTEPQKFGITERNSVGVEGEQFRIESRSVNFIGIDESGVYFRSQGDKTGLWRAYNTGWLK